MKAETCTMRSRPRRKRPKLSDVLRIFAFLMLSMSASVVMDRGDDSANEKEDDDKAKKHR